MTDIDHLELDLLWYWPVISAKTSIRTSVHS